MISNIQNSSEPLVASSFFIFAQAPIPTQGYRALPDLTDIIEALENFQDFEPAARATALTLHASELGISQMHFYALTLHADLRGRNE